MKTAKEWYNILKTPAAIARLTVLFGTYANIVSKIENDPLLEKVQHGIYDGYETSIFQGNGVDEPNRVIIVRDSGGKYNLVAKDWESVPGRWDIIDLSNDGAWYAGKPSLKQYLSTEILDEMYQSTIEQNLNK